MVRRDATQRRRTAYRRPASRILVVCCAQTEREYFDGLKRVAGLTALRVVVKVRSPEQLVEYAAKLRRQAADSFDEVWCVVDVDEFDIAKAVAAARKAEVSLAVSDPCFELWLLLHFGDHNAYVAGAKAACSLLAKHLPDYDKTIDYPALHANLDAAITRAKALGPDNPSTAVWKLVEAALNR